jgi:hypothetical protein
MKAGKTAEDTSSTPVIGQSPYIMSRSRGSHNAEIAGSIQVASPIFPYGFLGGSRRFDFG